MSSSDLHAVPESSSEYNDLKYYFSHLNILFSIRNTLVSDMMTAMPNAGLKRRTQEIANITKRIYVQTTAPDITKKINIVHGHLESHPDEYDEWDQANIREMKRIHTHLACVPTDLYLASVKVANEGWRRHEQALQGQDWSETATYLQQVVDLQRRIAERKQEAFGTESPYGALLKSYAGDLKLSTMEALYQNSLDDLKSLYQDAKARQENIPAPKKPEGNFSKNAQMELVQQLLSQMGFDFDRGGVFVVNHKPLATGNSQDSRVLVRCNEDYFLSSINDTLYHGAHGLYLQNLPTDWESQPVGQHMGSAMMNAISQLYKVILGRTPQFFDYLSHEAKMVFERQDDESLGAENLYQLSKQIRVTPVRDEADEFSQFFHDILRFRIEKDLIDGQLAVKDLPERWNAESEELLGVTPKSMAEGCLQNPDLFSGKFGFIASNTYSHIIATMLQSEIYRQVGDLPGHLMQGDLKPVTQWLSDNLFSQGHKANTHAHVENLAKGKIDVEALTTHLKRRYLDDAG